MSSVAVNDAGEVLVRRGDAWEPAHVAQNDAGERMYFDGSSWQPVPGAQPNQQEGGVGAWLGRRARDVVEGLSGFPSAAVEAMNPGRAAMRAFMPPEAGRRAFPTLSEVATGAADVMGLPRPQTDEERMTSAVTQGVIGAVPTMGVGAGAGAFARGANYLSQAVGGAAGGGASEAARQAGYGEGAQVAAGLVGGIGGSAATQAGAAALRGIGGAVSPFTQRGRETVVADTLLRSSDDPANLRTRIEAGVNTPDARLPGSPATTATAARDPRLLSMEASVRDSMPEVAGPLRDAVTGRARVQEAAIASMDDGRIPAERGAALRGERARAGQAGSGLRGAEQARRAVVRRAYEAVDPDGTSRLPLASLRRAVGEETRTRWGPGAGEIPGPLRSLFSELVDGDEAEAARPWADMQRIRSRASAIAGDAAADERVRASARHIRDAVDQAAQEAVAAGGFTAEQARRWRTAAELRRRLGEDFDRDTSGANATGRILAQSDYGAPRMVDEQVANAALANVSSLRQTLRASGGDAQVRQALQGQFIDRLMQSARGAAEVVDRTGTPQRTMSAAGFNRFWDQNRVIARELFGGQEYRRLELLARDFAEASIAANTGRTRNSQTAQNLTVAGLIARTTNGLVDDNPFARSAFGGPVLRWLYREPETAVKELLGQALADPRLAAMLLTRANPSSMRRAANYIEQSMLGRMGDAAATAAFRQTVRTSGEQQRRQAQQEQ